MHELLKGLNQNKSREVAKDRKQTDWLLEQRMKNREL